ncbi:MAG: hypothetical protein ACI8P3_003099 [Saprospiraceae bacterium]|jgi:hypothetical protein
MDFEIGTRVLHLSEFRLINFPSNRSHSGHFELELDS